MPANAQNVGITSVSTESRVFKPAKEFSSRAHVKLLAEYKKLYTSTLLQCIGSPDRIRIGSDDWEVSKVEDFSYGNYYKVTLCKVSDL